MKRIFLKVSGETTFVISFTHFSSPSVLAEMGGVAGTVRLQRPSLEPVWGLTWRGSQTEEDLGRWEKEKCARNGWDPGAWSRVCDLENVCIYTIPRRGHNRKTSSCLLDGGAGWVK